MLLKVIRCCRCFLPLLVAVLVLAGCSGDTTEEGKAEADDTPAVVDMSGEPQFRSVLPQEAFSLIEQDKHILIVDVRSPAEQERVRIAGSVAVSLEGVMRGETVLPRDRQLLLVCSVGGRSYAAGLYLLKEKYLRIYNLRGGIAAWEAAGLPLEQNGQ